LKEKAKHSKLVVDIWKTILPMEALEAYTGQSEVTLANYTHYIKYDMGVM
jgi:hypothetical protein